MKFPSLFKTPKYQRFNIEPRYYDPIKEEMEQRTSQIKREMELETNDDSRSAYQSRLEGSFARRRGKNKAVNVMQIIIAFILIGGFGGYIYFGDIALYVTFTISSLLLYLKVKGKI